MAHPRKIHKQSESTWRVYYYKLRDYQDETGKPRPPKNKKEEWLYEWVQVQKSRFSTGIMEPWQRQLWEKLPLTIESLRKKKPADTIPELKGYIYELKKHIGYLKRTSSRCRADNKKMMADMGELIVLLEKNDIKIPQHIIDWGKK